MNDFYAPTYRVKIKGSALQAEIARAITEVSFTDDLEMAHQATLQINDQHKKWVDSALFAVGNEVEVYMGYANKLQPMLLGQITSVEPNFPQSGAPTLTVRVYDKSQRMRQGQPSRPAYLNMTDSSIAAVIASTYGLKPVVDPTAPPHEKMSPTEKENDWQFLGKRAKANSFELFVEWDELHFHAPQLKEVKVYTLTYGQTLSSFKPRLSVANKATEVVVRGYDPKLGTPIVCKVNWAQAALAALGGQDAATIVSDAVGTVRRVISDVPVASKIEAQKLAAAVLQDSLKGLIKGSGACIGIPELRAGRKIELLGLGRRYSGEYYVNSSTHTIGSAGYGTTFEVNRNAMNPL